MTATIKIRATILTGLMLAMGLIAPACAAESVATPSGDPAVALVVGATGRLGRHLIRDLDAAGMTVRGMTRDPEQARAKYGGQYQWIAGDIRAPQTLSAAVAGVDFVVCAAGAITPTGPNAPQYVDYEGARNLIDASVAAGVKQFVLVSSIGVTQRFHLLNLTFGDVLHWKWEAEQHLRASGLTYTIVRPGGLRPGPAALEGISVKQGDAKGGSYIYLPDASAVIVATIGNPDAFGKTFEILSDREQSPDEWRDVFAGLSVD